MPLLNKLECFTITGKLINIIITHAGWLTDWGRLRTRPHFLLCKQKVRACSKHSSFKQKLRVCSKRSSFSQSMDKPSYRAPRTNLSFRYRTPRSVSQRERERKRERGRETERQRDTERKTERKRERCRIRMLYFIFNRNEVCLSTF